MVILSTIIVGYLCVGIFALLILDVLTKRIRNRLHSASYDAQVQLRGAGHNTGDKSAVFVTILALWFLWPVAIYAALSGNRSNSE